MVPFPLLVLGNCFTRLPAPLAAAALSLSSFFMGAYAALYAAGHRVFWRLDFGSACLTIDAPPVIISAWHRESLLPG
jgi:hypothetical protein